MERATASFLERILAERGPDLDLYGIMDAFSSAVAGGRFTAFGAVPLDRFLAACARSPALRKRYVAITERTRDRISEAVRAGQGAGSVRRDVDPRAVAGLLLAAALGAGVLLELRVPFEAGEHAAAMTTMLADR